MNGFLPSNEPLTASPDRIDLWLLFTGAQAASTDSQQAQYRALLTQDELQKEQRFHFERDRTRYLLTRVMVRSVLSRYAGVPADQWRFAPDKFGRPVIQNPMPETDGIVFNISHTDGLIALAVSSGRLIGVDAEALERHVGLDVANRFFSPTEAAGLQALPNDQRHRRLLELWTLKESYIKARGMGLSLPLDKFGFDLNKSDHIGLHVDDGFDDAHARWRFWQMTAGPRHLLALCATQVTAQQLRLLIRRVIPDRSEDPFDCHILRTNDMFGFSQGVSAELGQGVALEP